MEHLREDPDEDRHLEDMAAENSGLVGAPAPAKTNLLNILGNVCAVSFTAYIFYLSFFSEGVSLFSFHPTCMTVGWLILMTSAVNSLSPGDAATEWLPLKNRTTRHWLLQATALSCVVAGFLVILANKVMADKYHFTTFHACFGLASIVLAGLTATGGITTLYSLKLKKIIAPVYIKLIHSAAGIITVTLGIITMILGLFSAWWKGGDAARDVCVVLLLAVAVFTVLRPIVKLYARVRERITYVRSSN